jgi:hypothetical protein
LLRAKAAQERRNREKSDGRKNDIAASPQVLVLSEKRNQEKAKPDDRSDDRNMIQQKM